MVSPVKGICVFLPTGGTHEEAFHGGFFPVIRKRLDDGAAGRVNERHCVGVAVGYVKHAAVRADLQPCRREPDADLGHFATPRQVDERDGSACGDTAQDGERD